MWTAGRTKESGERGRCRNEKALTCVDGGAWLNHFLPLF
jgi:hypothetical protein